jgi:thiamine biosynthesis lipoprotein
MVNSKSKDFAIDLRVMGGSGRLTVAGVQREVAIGILHSAKLEIERIERKFSRYLEDSWISQLNSASGNGFWIKTDPETELILGAANDLFQITAGRFDPTVGALRKIWRFGSDAASAEQHTVPTPQQIKTAREFVGWEKLERAKDAARLPLSGMALDLGGLVKEYAVDRVAEIFEGYGVSGLCELGGDLRIVKGPQQGKLWRVGLKGQAADKLRGVVELNNGAIATSGDYERHIEIEGRRYCHIIDATTSYPVAGFRTVTAIADRCINAGALTTAAMLLGEIEGERLLRASKFPFFASRSDGSEIDLLSCRE